ncbi:hypothetical protein [Thermomonospora umbrina]|uniref:Uncharacterized protein n=1 Tax=Thermomonospora umbrina TaxID=111806 RepID=A0A3D9T8M8_9ACTN|nr:hypothetical protein [Thermomonospora umbrina]REF00112.1 hypothetical protein DFJ69_5640 [Thermomonospora umbrina]
MPTFKRPFGFQPLERQLAQRQAEQRANPVPQGRYFDHPTAKYLFVLVLIITVVLHVAALVVFGVLGFH